MFKRKKMYAQMKIKTRQFNSKMTELISKLKLMMLLNLLTGE